MAKSKGLSPDDFASRNQSFSRFWEVEQAKLEDMCPVAPAERSFPQHPPTFGEVKEASGLSGAQSLMTLHVYHCMEEMIRKVLLVKEANPTRTGIHRVKD